MNIRILRHALGRGLLLLVTTVASAHATDLVYAPRNPSFGGSPANGSILMSTAQAQNSTRAPTLSPQEKFNNSLQSMITSRILSELSSKMFGSGSSMTPGTYDAGSYTVTVTPTGVNGSSLHIVTTDKTTGAQASFDVSPTNLD